MWREERGKEGEESGRGRRGGERGEGERREGGRDEGGMGGSPSLVWRMEGLMW